MKHVAQSSIVKSMQILFLYLVFVSVLVNADRGINPEAQIMNRTETYHESNYLAKAVSNFLKGYEHIWPDLKSGWQIIAGTIIGFFGAACGSIGGIGGGGIFVPMLILIIGFDSKSATAVSKCMIMGTAGATAGYNLKQRHPMLDLPMVDYGLVLLIQPMLMLGISIGVTFNVVFPEWLLTILLIIITLGSSTKAFFKAVETWKKETILKAERTKSTQSIGDDRRDEEYKRLPGGPDDDRQKHTRDREVNIWQNIYWKELGLLVFVWLAFLVVQIVKNYTPTCSAAYWMVNLLQVPVSVMVFLYEAIGLYKGKRRIESKGDDIINWRFHHLLIICLLGVLAGTIAGLLGIGGGFVMGPLFLELGIHPQVASATATFGMTFSSSMSVVEFYLLNRFPIPYTLYFIFVAIVAAFVGQHIINKVIAITGRASIIVFVLAFTVFISALSLGGVGLANTIEKIKHSEYMGFEDLCKYGTE